MEVTYVRELSVRDAGAVARLGRKLYPPGFRENLQTLRRDLQEADAGESNLSVGIFRDAHLAGYILAYVVTPAHLKSLPGSGSITEPEIIYINDLVIEPRHRLLVRELLERFGQLSRRHFPSHPVAAHALGTRMLHWVEKHRSTAQALGYRLVEPESLPAPADDSYPDLFLVKWRPIPEPERLARVGSSGRGATRVCSYPINGVAYTVELLRNEAGWLTLEPVWDELRRKTPGSTVFQGFDYLRLWWLHFGLSNHLFILAVKQNGKVLGISPLQLSPVNILGRRYRQLGCLGSRWQVDRPALLLSERQEQCGEAVWRFLLEHRQEWDLCEFYEQIPDHSLLNGFRAGLTANGFLLGLTEDSFCPYLELTGSWQEFLTSRSRKFQKNLKSSQRRLNSCGELEYQSFRQGDLSGQLDRYAALEARSWKAERKVGCSRDMQYLSFYRQLASSFGSRNLFHLRFLTLDGEPIAGTFGLLEGENYYSLQIVHNPAFGRYSPGTLLEALEMEECFASGYREYDFLGGFLNNKQRWTEQGRRTVQLHGFSPTPRLRLFYLFYFVIKPAVKQRLRHWGLAAPLLRLRQLAREWRRDRSKGTGTSPLPGEASHAS